MEWLTCFSVKITARGYTFSNMASDWIGILSEICVNYPNPRQALNSQKTALSLSSEAIYDVSVVSNLEKIAVS